MKKVHTVLGILLAFIIYASCSTLQYSTENVHVDKSEVFECECGPNTESCTFIENEKMCRCAEGFSLNNDSICEVCDCGTNSIKCEFIEDIKTCTCATGFSEKEGFCAEWTCTNDRDCKNEAMCEGEAGDNKKCHCKPGTTGDVCDIVTDCLEDGKYEKCKGEAGNCLFKTGKAVCQCPEKKILYEDEGYCKEWTCTTDSDCINEAICEEEEDGKKCKCKHGTKGDVCDIVTECVKGGKFENCNGDSGHCYFQDGATICKCPERKIFDEDNGYCNEPCNTDTDCQNEGYCKDTGYSKFCDCKPGTFGDKCGNIIDCEDGGKYENCRGENGECVFENGASVCKCEDNKKLDEISGYCKVDHCASNPCQNGGTCINGEDTYSCACPDFYEGADCSRNTWCEKFGEATCGNEKCEYNDKIEKGECICEAERVFNEIAKKCIENHCVSNPCQNGGTCTNGEDAYNCACLAFYEEKDCSRNTWCEKIGKVECGYEKCEYNAKTGKGECICEDDKIFNVSTKTCIVDHCAASPCKNGGTCRNDEDVYHCICPGIYGGITCEDIIWCDIHGKKMCGDVKCTNDKILKTGYCECEEYQKFNNTSKTCEDQCNPNMCENGGECIVVEGEMKCKCKAPYTGDRCETKSNCENGRYVMDKHGKMKCACNPKHSLTDDETCKPCDCGNKGKCIFQMKVLNGSIQYWKMCVCNKGSAEKDGKCVDCNCGPNSLCEFEGEEKHCYCEEGYTEKNGVCTGVCTDNPCKNGGTCEIRENGYKCICNDHYFGKMCEIGPCADSPCKNGGTCEVVGNDYKCTCKDPYFGKMCEMDSCTPNPCQNGGTCFVDGNMFRCSCVYLVSGTTCEIDNRFILAALLLLVVLVFLIIVCGGCCLFKIKQKISQNFQP